jgi:hypothetical protein
VALWARSGTNRAVLFTATGHPAAGAGVTLTRSGDALTTRLGRPDGTVATTFSVPLPPAGRDWVHYALTRDGSGVVAIYVNGERVRHGAEPVIFPDPITPGRVAVARPPGPTWVPTAYGVDEFCLFTRALTADEVRRLAGKK